MLQRPKMVEVSEILLMKGKNSKSEVFQENPSR